MSGAVANGHRATTVGPEPLITAPSAPASTNASIVCEISGWRAATGAWRSL